MSSFTRIPSWQQPAEQNKKLHSSALLPNLDEDPLNCLRLPPRLTKAQTAKFLNMGQHDIPILVRAGLLKPLGHPNDSNQKYFATADLIERAEDREWLAQVSDVLYKHWYKINAAKRRKSGGGEPGADEQ